MKDKIRAFLQQRLNAKRDTRPFSDAEPLFVTGRLDSLDAMETVVFLERELGIDFAEVGFDLELIDSVDAIAALADDHPPH